MAQTFLIFDFGSNEDAAQQARHTIDRWKQGFRLDKKMLLKFDRGPSDDADDAKDDKKGAAESRPIQLIVRLDFSDHERLSHQRWVDRLPGEALFKDAKPKVVRPGDADFAGTAERFDSLA
jgi:hypothetical protein